MKVDAVIFGYNLQNSLQVISGHKLTQDGPVFIFGVGITGVVEFDHRLGSVMSKAKVSPVLPIHWNDANHE